MIYTIRIDDSDSKARALLEFLRTLDFIKLERDEEIDFPGMTEEEILQQAIAAEEDIRTGNYITQEQLIKDAQKW